MHTTTDKLSVVEASAPEGTTYRMSAVTTDKLSGKYIEERNQREQSSSSRSRAPDPTRGTATASVDNEPDVDLDQWPESVKAIRAAEFFSGLSRELLVGIIRRVHEVGLADPQFAEVVRRDGPALWPECRRTPQLWGWRLAEAEAREIEDRKKAQSHATTPQPKARSLGELPSVEPTGRVRRAKAPCVKNHWPPLVWITDENEERCVSCKPPNDTELLAEARQMLREWPDKQASPP